LNLTNDLSIEMTDFNKEFLNEVDVRPAEKMWVQGAGNKK